MKTRHGNLRKISLIMVVMLMFSIYSVPITVSAESIAQELIYITEDGYVETNKNTNETTWLNNEHLRLHGSNFAFRVVFIKFEVPEFNGEIKGATLKLTSNAALTVPEDDTLTVHMVTDNAWDSVSNNPTYEGDRYIPQVDDTALATYTLPSTDVKYGQVIEIDIKDMIKQSGTYSVAIKRSGITGDLRFFSDDGATSEIRRPHINMSISGTIESGHKPQLPEVEPGEDGWRRRIVEKVQEDGSIIKYGWSPPSQSAEAAMSEIPEVGNGTVIEYDNIAGLRKSDVYSVYVNGREIFTEKFKDVSIARFAFEGEVTVKVVAKEAVSTFNISPHSYGVKGAAEGNSVLFTLSKPGYMTVDVNLLERLFLFADPPEQSIPSGENVINVLDMGIDNTGSKTETVKIQAAVDMASEIPGGVVYFPSGRYAIGSLNLKSNTHIYLENGAHLICVINSEEDVVQNAPISDGNSSGFGGFLYAVEAENIKISGRGIIDVDGERYRKEETYRRAVGRMVFLIRSKNIVIEDVILRDSTSWNSHILHCDNVTYKNVKIINNVTTLTTDGIDIDSSRDVLIDGVFIYNGDDSVVVKATGLYYTNVYNARDTYNITVRNSVLISTCAAMKVGTETNTERIYDIVFENNDIIATDVAFKLFTYDGAVISDVSVINNRCEFIGIGEHPHVHNRPFYFQITERKEELPREPGTEISRKGKIKNIYIKDFSIENYGAKYSHLMGLDKDHKVEDIVFENVTVAGELCLNSKDLMLTKNDFVGDIIFKGPGPKLPKPKDDEIRVVLDNKQVIFSDRSPLIKNGRTLVPFRAIFEEFGADVAWDAKTETVTAKKDDISMTLIIDDIKAMVGDNEITLDQAAEIIDGRTMVPLRFIGEAMNCKVIWNRLERVVDITTSDMVTEKGVVMMDVTKIDSSKAEVISVIDDFDNQNTSSNYIMYPRDMESDIKLSYDSVEKPELDGNVSSAKIAFNPTGKSENVWRMLLTNVSEQSSEWEKKGANAIRFWFKGGGEELDPKASLEIAFKSPTTHDIDGKRNNFLFMARLDNKETEWTQITIPLVGLKNALTFDKTLGFTPQLSNYSFKMGDIESLRIQYDTRNEEVTNFNPLTVWVDQIEVVKIDF